MSVGTEQSPLNMIAGEDLEAHRLVRLSGSTENTLVYADAGERAIGVTLVRATSGQMVAVEMLASAQSLKVIAAGTITVNSVVYSANDGKVSDSVSGNAIGILRTAGVANQAAELIPYGQPGGNADTDLVVFDDDFLWRNVDESGSEGFWVLDANHGGAGTAQDAQGGRLALTASDGTAADNDETYLVSKQEIYLPAIGAYNGEVLARVKSRHQFTEANTDDASILFGLLGGHDTDVANTIANGGAALADADQYIAFLKSDGGTVYKGVVRDTAQDQDADVGARISGSMQTLEMVIYDADITDGELEVAFLVDGVSGGVVTYAVSGATAMRLIYGVKNGGANAESLIIDRCRIEFKR